MFDAAVTWAKEYGDVLGTVGFLFALTTVILTNGKLILERMRGGTVAGVSPEAITIGEVTPAATGTAVVDAPPLAPDYGDKVAVAVSPPKELGDIDPHFAAGLADDIIADLQQAGFATPDIAPVSRLVENGADPQTIARHMGVGHVLTSSVRRQENKLRITVQLVDPSGAVMWSDRYNTEGDDLMAIQEHVANRIAMDVAGFVKPGSALRDPETGRAFRTRDEALAAVSSPKSRLIALLLCIPPLGIFGVHRFYVGRPYTGLLYIPTVGLFAFGWIIDTILITLGMFADGKGRPVRLWQPDPLKQFADKK